MLPVVKEDRCKWSWHWEVFVCDLKVTGGRLAWSLDGARIRVVGAGHPCRLRRSWIGTYSVLYVSRSK